MHEKGKGMSSLQRLVWWALLSCTALVAVGCIIFPPKIHFSSFMVPTARDQQDEAYRTEPDSSISYAVEGLRLNVRYLTDAELNKLLPEDSVRGKYSTNPYTYGDYIDRDVGYTPNRFTTFRISVFNQTFAKVEFDPLAAVLHTDQGEVLHAYGIPSTSPHNSFERYYRSLRGQSGNEFYRFEVRMGHVRSLNYAENQPVFKGEKHSGLIAFDALDPEVKRVRLVLKEFAIKFDEFGNVIESINCQFDFDRHTEKWTEVEEALVSAEGQNP